MDPSLNPEQRDLAIEDALRTYPVAAMPRDLTAEVMARLGAAASPRTFRLAWSDLALGLILSACLGAVWFSLNNLPPLAAAQIHRESILLYQRALLNADWLIPLASFALAAFCAALALPSLRRELTR